MRNLSKHIFVLGAGASVASANTPLGKNLIWDYHLDSFLLLPTDNMEQALHEENAKFKSLREYLGLVESIYPEYKYLLEQWDNRDNKVFQAGSSLGKRLYFDEILDVLEEKGNEDGIKCVKQVIFEHIVAASFDSQNVLYKRFVKEILKNKAPQTTSVISLNFDCLLHEDFESQIYFDYLIDFDWFDPNRELFYRHSNPIPLIKLHGSVDWGMCENCERLHLYYPFMHSAFYEGKVCTNNKCVGVVNPFITTPHESRERLKHLWNVAKNHLKKAEKVTVIGYSFPPHDDYVINLFRDSLDASVQIEVIDKFDKHRYSQEIEQFECIRRKYKFLFPNIKQSIKVTLDEFSGYLNSQGKPHWYPNE
jgi:NAD-dependent SIR2 family protein deacetylase